MIITALGTQSPGSFEVVDNADVNFDTCQFTGMGDFTFLSNSEAVDCIWTNCGQIDAGDANLSGSSVIGYEGTADTSALIWNVATDPQTDLANMTFEKGTAATHAIEFGTTSPTTMTLDGMTFTGYGADSTTSSALHFKRTSGTVTVSVVNGTVPTYKSDGATISISAAVTVTIEVVDENDDPIENAQTAVFVGSTQVMNEDTNASGIATESYTGTTPASATWRIRKSSSGATKYVAASGPATIATGTGLTLKVVLREDPIAN